MAALMAKCLVVLKHLEVALNLELTKEVHELEMELECAE